MCYQGRLCVRACVPMCVFAQAAVLCSAALKAQGSAKLTPCLSTPELLNTFAEASGNKLKGPISAATCRRAEQRGGSGGVCWYPQPDLQLLLFILLPSSFIAKSDRLFFNEEPNTDVTPRCCGGRCCVVFAVEPPEGPQGRDLNWLRINECFITKFKPWCR